MKWKILYVSISSFHISQPCIHLGYSYLVLNFKDMYELSIRFIENNYIVSLDLSTLKRRTQTLESKISEHKLSSISTLMKDVTNEHYVADTEA